MEAVGSYVIISSKTPVCLDIVIHAALETSSCGFFNAKDFFVCYFLSSRLIISCALLLCNTGARELCVEQ